MGFFKYIKSAFLYHWNLLAVGAGTGFALLSGIPDILLPLVLAGEITYLSLLGTNSKFQKYVDAHADQRARAQGSANAEQTLKRIRTMLPRELDQRFDDLRSRCLELRQIAQNLRDPTRAGSMPLEELQLSGLDRLLWIYLRLLFSHYMLQRFFRRTSEREIQSDIEQLEQQLQRVDAARKQKVHKTLEDNLATCRERLANYQRARDNAELIRLEIDRLENKIQSLSELAINRHEPDFITTQVDQVAESMVHTERTMNELRFATGLSVEEAVPRLVERSVVEQTR